MSKRMTIVVEERKRMDDLISRQAAIDAISCDITITGRQNAELIAETIGSFVDRIKRIPSAQPEQRWIPVTERLPENDDYVLIADEQFFGGEIVAVARYRGTWEWRDDMSTSAPPKPFMWMPLPEPYKPERSE